MTTIHIHPPDGAAAERFTLASDEALVAGRDPDLTAGAAAAGAPAPTRRLVVASPLISSNHVLLWRDQDSLYVRDLESKNGTYLGLQGGVDVSLRGPSEAHLFLAAPRPAARPAAPSPVSVADADADAFAHRLRDAVTDWLAQGGARPVVRVIRDEAPDADPAGDDDRFRIPLVDGLTLEIADHDMARTRVRWDGFKAELFPFVDDQLAAFRACRVARVGRPLAYRSPVAERVLREVLDAARARLPLVITGESGTGKTELAAIYGGRNALRPGRRASDGDGPPFVTVHCAHLEPALAHTGNDDICLAGGVDGRGIILFGTSGIQTYFSHRYFVTKFFKRRLERLSRSHNLGRIIRAHPQAQCPEAHIILVSFAVGIWANDGNLFEPATFS